MSASAESQVSWKGAARALRRAGRSVGRARLQEPNNVLMSRSDRWIDPRGSREPPQAARFYPDLIRAGSLADALNRELAKRGSPIRSSPDYYGFQSWSWAEVSSDDRNANVHSRADKRKFGLDLWEDAIHMARGTTRDLSDLAFALELLMSHADKRVSDLVQRIPFMKLKPRALRYENGTYIEVRWQALLADPFDGAGNEIFHWDDLAELIRQAAERPELRRHLPFTSLHRFSVTRRRQLPETTIPKIWPLGNGQYRLTPDHGPHVAAEGDASVVLDALVEEVRKAPQ